MKKWRTRNVSLTNEYHRRWMGNGMGGAEYNTFGEALEQLDEFLEEVKTDGLDYSRDDYRIKFIEGIVMEFTPEGWEDDG